MTTTTNPQEPFQTIPDAMANSCSWCGYGAEFHQGADGETYCSEWCENAAADEFGKVAGR